jgi:cell division septum initiation protein DivIVA
MKSDDLYFKSKLAIAKSIGVHRHTIDSWIEKIWFPKPTKNGWLKEEVFEAVRKYNDESSVDPDAINIPGSREEKTALECARLKIVIEKEKELLEQAKEETRRMVEEGRKASRKLIPKSEVEEGLTEFMAQLRSVIQSWCKSAQADDPENQQAYDRAVKLYLDKMQEIGSELSP